MREKSTVRTYWLSGVLLLAFLTVSMTTIAFAQTITLATHYPPTSIAVLEPCFRAYEAQNPGVTIEHQQITYGDYLQTILTSPLRRSVARYLPRLFHLGRATCRERRPGDAAR